jgi:hypothetical protein
MSGVDNFYRQIIAAKKKPKTGYGGNVIPAMEIYAKLNSPEDRKAYQEALERMLSSKDLEVRRYGINLCLGFFVFRDVLKSAEK